MKDGGVVPERRNRYHRLKLHNSTTVAIGGKLRVNSWDFLGVNLNRNKSFHGVSLFPKYKNNSMKSLFSIILSILLVQFSIAQELHEHACSKSKISNAMILKTSHKSISDQDKYNLNYVKLDLTLDNLSTKIDRGHATLKASVTAFSMDIFVCELISNLQVDSAKINSALVSVNRQGDELQLFLPSSLSQGEELTVDIFYQGTPPSGGSFFGGIFNAASPSWGAQVTWTLSQPFSAHTWWPSKQVLTDKIDSSEVWLTVPNNLKAGSNGLLVNEVSLPGNKTRFEWKHQHMIDYYLISMAVGPYIDYSFMAALPGTNDSVLVQNYIYDNPNTLPNFLNEINLTADMLYVFSDLYGLYPFRDEKYGHCMAPLSGGMEHQTMTTQGFFETGLTAHELGHQWFGDHVTCENWGHIWVNEGFASYSEYLFYQSLSQNQAQQVMVDAHNSAMSQGGGSVFVPLADQGDDNRIFSSRLSYDKGSALVHMVRHWVNDDALFFAAMKSYQVTFANSTASAEDFIQEVETVTGVAMTDFLNHWYYGEGYPTYGGKFNQATNGIVIELNQTTSRPSVTPFFASHIELAIEFLDGLDTVIYVANSANNQQYFFPINKEIYTVTVDPANWVLNKDAAFTKEESLVYTGIADRKPLDENLMNIYPNPSDGIVHLIVKDESVEFVLVNDLTGRMVRKIDLNEGSNFLDLKLASGVYFLSVESKDARQIEALVIK